MRRVEIDYRKGVGTYDARYSKVVISLKHNWKYRKYSDSNVNKTFVYIRDCTPLLNIFV